MSNVTKTPPGLLNLGYDGTIIVCSPAVTSPVNGEISDTPSKVKGNPAGWK